MCGGNLSLFARCALTVSFPGLPQYFLVVAALLNVIEGSSLTPRDRMACIDGKICHLDKDHLDFFVLGDTGGSVNVSFKPLNV